jgi:hypothetical protein
MTLPVYNIRLHRHNFAAWAAARATQRGFTTTENLKNALESSGIQRFIERPCGQAKFGGQHRKWCRSICTELSAVGVGNATYGRAAKLVAVYLKSMVVLLNPSSEEAAYIHPPVDRILLQNIARDAGTGPERSQMLRGTSWTKLGETEYFDLISALSDINGDRPFWKLEEYWDVTPGSS